MNVLTRTTEGGLGISMCTDEEGGESEGIDVCRELWRESDSEVT